MSYLDGLLSFSNRHARTYTLAEGLPRQESVMETGGGDLLLLPAGTPQRAELLHGYPPWHRQAENVRYSADLRRLEESKEHPLAAAVAGDLLVGRRRVVRITTAEIEQDPDVETLRLESFDPAALHVDTGALVASPELAWESEIPSGRELTATLDAFETRVAFVVSRRDGGPHVQVHDLYSGQKLGAADLCVADPSTGLAVDAASVAEASAPDPATGPLPALDPMGCEAFYSIDSWSVPLVAFERGRLLIVQARYFSLDWEHGWIVQGLRAYDLVGGELLEVGSWALPTAADILHFDGRRAWIAQGTQPGLLDWSPWAFGHGRILILDTSNPAAAPTVVDLPQTPTSLVFRDGRMHLGSVTGVSTVSPACPAP